MQINDHSYALSDQNDQSPAASGQEWLARVRDAEKHYTEKLKNHLQFIDGVFVMVTCEMNNERSEKSVLTLDGKNVVSKIVSENNSTEENNSGSTKAIEPGVSANQGLSVEAPAGGDKTSGTIEKSVSQFYVGVPKTEEKKTNPGGEAKKTGVSVLIPRSYLIRTYKATQGADKEPNATVLQAFIDTELQGRREMVRKALALPAEVVGVSAYVDSLPNGVAMTAAASTSPVSLMFTDHAKEIGLGALALVSLFMVSNMVKKGVSAAPAPAVAMAHGGVAPRAATQLQGLQGREEAVGEAMEGDPLLDGMELDEESAKAQQMLNQVSELVEENPDAAANLVKRWMNRS